MSGKINMEFRTGLTQNISPFPTFPALKFILLVLYFVNMNLLIQKYNAAYLIN